MAVILSVLPALCILAATMTSAHPTVMSHETRTHLSRIPDETLKLCAGIPKLEGPFPMIPSPDSCTKFIICDGIRGIEMSCPAGLYFNDQKKTCDWPRNVDCVEPISTDEPPSETILSLDVV